MTNAYTMESGSYARHPGDSPGHLTPRQREVLALLCEGLPNKLICRQLNISAATVKVHIGCILRALNVNSRLQAVIVAHRCGLASAAVVQPETPVAPPHGTVMDDVAARFLETVSRPVLAQAA